MQKTDNTQIIKKGTLGHLDFLYLSKIRFRLFSLYLLRRYRYIHNSKSTQGKIFIKPEPPYKAGTFKDNGNMNIWDSNMMKKRLFWIGPV